MDTVSGNRISALPGTRRARRYPDLALLAGHEAWSQLPAAVRARFPAAHRDCEPILYRGVMRRVELSRCGRFLAAIARVFRTPIAPFAGRDVATDVIVFPDPSVPGVVWERVYRFDGRAPVHVSSMKCLGHRGRLLERLGNGLAMRLDVRVEEETLVFVSRGYVLRLAGLEIPLPAWLPPGVTRVAHRDEGGGRFRFTLSTEHPLFGRMFYQEGVFERAGSD